MRFFGAVAKKDDSTAVQSPRLGRDDAPGRINNAWLGQVILPETTGPSGPWEECSSIPALSFDPPSVTLWFSDPETCPQALPTFVLLVVVLIVSPKAFSFRNRLFLNFAQRLATIFSAIYYKNRTRSTKKV